LDEPTEGIQPNIIQQIGRVIGYLRDQGQMAILLVEQYFDFAYRLADHIYVMERGEIILQGAKCSLSKNIVRSKLAV
jgi:urea transport system ATP-binding protein